jgi:hypothetical protein
MLKNGEIFPSATALTDWGKSWLTVAQVPQRIWKFLSMVRKILDGLNAGICWRSACRFGLLKFHLVCPSLP